MIKKWTKWSLMIPAGSILLFVALWPLIFSFVMSLFKWPKTPVDPMVFSWVYNYARIAVDPDFLDTFWVIVKFIAMAVPLELVFGFILALAIFNVTRFRGSLCSFLLIPSMLSPVAVGVIWILLFSTYYGPINYILDRLFSIKDVLWLASSKLALPSIVVADVWQWTPFVMIVLLAGLVSLPQELFEAASIDGASYWQALIYVTIPLLKPVILVALIMRTVDALKLFALPFVMTSGGPGASTETLTLYIYKVAFQFWDLSYAAALCLCFFIIAMVIVTACLRLILRS